MNPAIARKRHAKAASMQEHHNGDRRQQAEHRTNVGENERQISMIGGGVLAAYGLLRGSLSGLALAALGGALLWRGYTGHCEMYHALGYSTAEGHEHGEHEH